MSLLQRITIEDLFGYVRHDIALRGSEPTILTGPNGAGKTHVLMITRAALALDTRGLAPLPFGQVALTLTDGRTLSVLRRPTERPRVLLTFTLLDSDGEELEPPILIESSLEEGASKGLPSYVEEMADGNWYDARRGRVVTRAQVQTLYRTELPPSLDELFGSRPALLRAMRDAHPILIDTKRLDAPEHSSRPELEFGTSRPSDAGASRIGRYINRIRAEVVVARQESIRVTQSSDLSFAARALAAASETVYERVLHARYDRIVDSYERLSRNGLAIGEAPLAFPPRTTPTVRRILNVFLDDWERRLQPLLPLNAKLDTLRDILDSKLSESGKRTKIDTTGRLGFETIGRRRIRVSSLSSGEQHLVALFTLLLFASRRGSLVLIDEPEISMHAAWKHAFLEDITRVASIANLQVIVATHSTAIVNGRWDLEEALELNPPPEPALDIEEELEVETDELFS